MEPPYFTVIARRPSGRFKVYWTGRAEGHIMDWRGCNYRHLTVAGQPQGGFATLDEACAFELLDHPLPEGIGERAGFWMAASTIVEA